MQELSLILTLYFDVEDRRESLPGTEQNTSDGDTANIPGSLGHQSALLMAPRPPHTVSSFLMVNPTSGPGPMKPGPGWCCSSGGWKPRG